MAFLRHATRHIHHTVANHIEAYLGELGWTSPNAAERPFGAAQVKVRRSTPVVDGRQGDLFAGLCAITTGPEPSPDEQEMGGPAALQEIPFFIDILMDEHAYALCLACDIRDICLGRVEGSRTVFPVVDQSTRAAVAGWRITLDDVERSAPEVPMSLYWQVVKVTAEVEFNEGTF